MTWCRLPRRAGGSPGPNRLRIAPSVSVRAGRSLAGLLFAGGLSVGLQPGWGMVVCYVEAHPYFTIRDVVVTVDGDRFAPHELQALAGVRPGMSIWAVDPREAAARLLENPWIRAASVRRELPRRVLVQVHTRQPVAILRGPQRVFVDETGRLLPMRATDGFEDLPYFTRRGASSSGGASGGNWLAGALFILEQSADWNESVSEILWDEAHGHTVFLSRRRVTVRLGRELATEKWSQLAAVLADWPVDGPPVVLDGRFAGQIVVRPYPVPPRPTGAAATVAA